MIKKMYGSAYSGNTGLRVPLKNEKFKNNFLLIHGVAIGL